MTAAQLAYGIVGGLGFAVFVTGIGAFMYSALGGDERREPLPPTRPVGPDAYDQAIAEEEGRVRAY
jgi:hypothetical protein